VACFPASFRLLTSFDGFQMAKGPAHSISTEFVDSFCRNIYSISFFSQSVPLFASAPPGVFAGEIGPVGADVLAQRREVVRENIEMYLGDPYEDAAQVWF
jgi:hypothetical protein